MRIIINGAGIAGPTLAYWLRRGGHDVLLVEAASELRRGSSPTLRVLPRGVASSVQLGSTHEFYAAKTRSYISNCVGT